MKITFCDFWKYPKEFNEHNNFFIHIIRSLFENVQVVNPEDADIMFFSNFGNENMMYKNCKKIYYTGENQRPNFHKCDFSLTFDFDDYGKRNYRLPLWYLYIDWFNVETYDNPQWLIPESYLYGKNEFNQKEKNKFCSIVFGNPVQSRMEAIDLISKYKPVEIYGKANPNHILPDGERNKLDLISNYKFSLCYENSVTPGYHTEKLLHGKIAGTIPIYYGDESSKEDFNVNCFINALELSPDELINKIYEIDTIESKYQEIINQPLFAKKINLDRVKTYFYQILK